MKKLLLVLAIGSLFAVACNDGGSADTESKTDTAAAATTVDTTAAQAPADTTAPAPAVDTTKKVDTLKKK
ncbi:MULTISPECIES: hypothetical protein [Niastella]|uniref:Entericidin n=1 Tax=Niastella soli TaxID=2821487 RepID=A0ABS3YT68_9BACT|nr:hypothetical protein [Niastella soli]MBO9201091.1 hypothetical protein [Niastella soli]